MFSYKLECNWLGAIKGISLLPKGSSLANVRNIRGVCYDREKASGTQGTFVSENKVKSRSLSLHKTTGTSRFVTCALAGWGSRDGAVVRALASHQCGPGSTPGPGVICGLSLLLVLVLAPRGFSPCAPVFPSPQKPTHPNSNSNLDVSPISILC